MRTVPLGDTGVEVSALCLGCMYFGSTTGEEMSFALLDRYRRAGGTFLDTANNYAFWIDGFEGGESERLLGRWMAARGNRDEIFLASKVGANRPPADPRNLSAAKIGEECRLSLERLGTDHLDLYYAHIDDRATPLAETLEAFDRLVRAGTVRFVGCSNIADWRLERARALSAAHGWAAYCCVQQRHSYLRPKAGLAAFANGQVPVTTDLMDYAAENPAVTILGYSPLLGGAYARADHRIPDNYQPHEYAPDDARERLQVLHTVAAEAGATPNQVVLAWMLGGSPPIVPIVATGSPDHLAEDLGALQITLTKEQLARLDAAGA